MDTMNIKWKWVLCLVLAVLLIASIAGQGGRTFNSIMSGWDAQTSSHLDTLITKASLSLVISAALNSVISVVKDSELNIVIGSLALGEALDPVDDAVEQFTNILWLSTASLAIQKFIHFLTIRFAGILLTLSILPFFVASLMTVIDPNHKRIKLSLKEFFFALGKAFLTLFILSRLLIPLVVLISRFAEYQDIDAQIEVLQDIQESTESDYNILNQEQNRGVLSSITSIVPDIRESISSIINTLKESIRKFVELSITFIIQTIIIPLITLILLKMAFRQLTLIFTKFKKDEKGSTKQAAPAPPAINP